MLEELIERHPELKVCTADISNTIAILTDSYNNGGKLLICGNGGSCSDSEHIVGELMKGFLNKRQLSEKYKAELKSNCPELTDEELCLLQGALPAIPLPAITGVSTAFCNDVESSLVFAQQVLGLGKKNDVFLGISTSGNSKNVVAAAKVAKGLGLKVITLTGESGGKLKELSDICIRVPATETYKVQELHLPVYHEICIELEKQFF